MEILKLKAACKDYIWGGVRLKEEYHKQFDGDRLAECWELSCHPDGLSVIANGPFAGQTLRDYIASSGRRVLGSNCQIFREFPVLIKLIDAKDNLSIQVHPNNLDALEKETQYGKTEMWYVLEAGPNAFLYNGFRREISKEEFRRRIQDGTLPETLNAVPAHRGDIFYIPAGTLHAIGRDLVVVEIGQSSNVTYRVFDYNRLGADGSPRKLHIDQALEVTRRTPPRTDYNFGGHLVRNAYFTVDLIEAPHTEDCDDESFTSLLIIDGAGNLQCGNALVTCRKGDSLFLPANSGKFTLSGHIRALKTRTGTV